VHRGRQLAGADQRSAMVFQRLGERCCRRIGLEIGAQSAPQRGLPGLVGLRGGVSRAEVDPFAARPRRQPLGRKVMY